MMNILLIERDAIHAKLISQYMATENVNIALAFSAEFGIRVAKIKPIDLLVLDWQPQANFGLELIEKIQSHSAKRVPVIFISSRLTEMELDLLGRNVVDDYILRPLSGIELARRVGTWTHRNARDVNMKNRILAGKFFIDLSERKVLLQGVELHLMPKEYEILSFLFKNIDKTISRQLISVAVWGNIHSDNSRTLDTLIYRLRKKHGLSPENGVRLVSVYTRGYRLEETAEAM